MSETYKRRRRSWWRDIQGTTMGTIIEVASLAVIGVCITTIIMIVVESVA